MASAVKCLHALPYTTGPAEATKKNLIFPLAARLAGCILLVEVEDMSSQANRGGRAMRMERVTVTRRTHVGFGWNNTPQQTRRGLVVTPPEAPDVVGPASVWAREWQRAGAVNRSNDWVPAWWVRGRRIVGVEGPDVDGVGALERAMAALRDGLDDAITVCVAAECE